MPTQQTAAASPPGSHPPRLQLTAAERYQLQLAALEDSAGLALVWDDALRASFELGHSIGSSTGYHAGWLAGRDEEAAAWQTIMTGYAQVIKQPTYGELVRRRQPSNEPCSARCARCSRCIRAEHVQANLARYGQPDFPGLDGVEDLNGAEHGQTPPGRERRTRHTAPTKGHER